MSQQREINHIYTSRGRMRKAEFEGLRRVGRRYHNQSLQEMHLDQARWHRRLHPIRGIHTETGVF